MKRRASAVAALLLVGTAVVGAGSSSAAQTGTAVIEVTGSGFLDPFPCPVSVECSGSFEGTANGAATGLNGVIPWAVSIPAGRLSATFLYNDSCEFDLGGDVPSVGNAVLGFAAGTGLVTASLSGAPIGTYGPDPNGPLKTPAFITEVEAPFAFSWTRVGATAAMSMTSSMRIKVLLSDGPTWIDVATNSPGRGAAAFLPTTGEMLPTCAEPDGVTAFVVGGSIFASSS